jgi:hypothetical protein
MRELRARRRYGDRERLALDRGGGTLEAPCRELRERRDALFALLKPLEPRAIVRAGRDQQADNEATDPAHASAYRDGRAWKDQNYGVYQASRENRA